MVANIKKKLEYLARLCRGRILVENLRNDDYNLPASPKLALAPGGWLKYRDTGQGSRQGLIVDGFGILRFSRTYAICPLGRSQFMSPFSSGIEYNPGCCVPGRFDVVTALVVHC